MRLLSGWMGGQPDAQQKEDKLSESETLFPGTHTDGKIAAAEAPDRAGTGSVAKPEPR